MPTQPLLKRTLLAVASLVAGVVLVSTLYDTQLGPGADTASRAIVSNELDGSHNSALPPPDPAHLSAAERRQVRAAFARLTEDGLFKTVEIPARRVLVDGRRWDALTPEARQEAARTMALHLTEQTGRGLEAWDLYDAASGERLARYAVPDLQAQ